VVDNLTPTDPQPTDVAPKRGLGGLLSSTAGRIIFGVAGLALLLAVAAGIYFFAFSGGGTDEVPGGVVPATDGAAGAGGVAVSVVPTEPPAVPLDDVFTFRDIFVPTIKEPSTSTPTTNGDGSSTDTSTPDTTGNTIFIQSTSVEDGVEVATVLYNGQSYTVSEGERVGSSPWQVLSIDGETVVMLFGDSQVTLTVGQGITK